MLVQIALVVLALLAMLSLVVDLGVARLTQSQMQTAADAAALEGLRRRDLAADPAVGEADRRGAARDLVQWTFDDNFGPTDGDAGRRFGAGPIIDLTDGSGTLHAYATTSVPDVPVYKPLLQLNEQNEAYGDLVSGRFCYNADPVPPEGSAHAQPGMEVCGSPQPVTGPYARNDFNPGADNGAFLVRLRRSNDFEQLPAQTDPEIGSSGPALPLLFGRGTMIRAHDADASYSVRRDGLTVRATAIADAWPAAHVGLPQPAAIPPMPGVTPFVLSDAFVRTVDPSQVPAGCPVTVNTDGSIMGAAGGAAACPLPGPSVGRFVAPVNDPTRQSWAVVSTIGRPRPAPVAAACAAVTTIRGYTPVTARLASGVNRVIGFAPIQLARTGACPPAGTPFLGRVVRGGSLVAPANATATLYDGLPLPADAAESEIAELLDRHLARNGRLEYGALLTPVIAR